MGDMGDDFRAMKDHYRKVRANRLVERTKFLQETGWKCAYGADGYVRIYTQEGNYDVWLTTGTWTKVGTNKFQQGWNNLIKILRRI